MRGIDKKCNVEGLKVRMKFLCEGLIRNVEMLYRGTESENEFPLQLIDKKCNVEGLEVKIKFRFL